MKVENIEKFIYDNNIKCDDLGNVYVKVIEGGLQFFPIDNLEECIIITKEQLRGFLNDTLDYDATNNSFKEINLFTEEKKRIRELKKLLLDTDYQAIKYAEGILSEEAYSSIKTQRQSWRDEINYLEEVVVNG